MESTIKLEVNKIIGSDVNGYSRVTLAYNLFNAVKGANPTLEFTKESSGVRKFIIEGVVIYSYFTVNDGKASTTFIMRTEDANKYLVAEKVSTLPFDIKSFTVATA